MVSSNLENLPTNPESLSTGQVLNKADRESSAYRKSVSFKQLVNENTERNRSSGSNRKSLKRSRRSSSRESPSFGANNSIYDDTADFEELDYVDSIPTEGKRSLLRSSGFSATKDKTRKNKNSFFSPNKLSLANHEKGYRMTEVKVNRNQISSTIKNPRSGTMKFQKYLTNSSQGGIERGSRTEARNKSLKQVALKLVKYGELQMYENTVKNTLCMQPNYNAGFGFEILNPDKGSVDASRLHNALRTNLKISLVDKNVVEDIIGRLAYVNENELVLSDMSFFEPSRDFSSYPTYMKNFNRDQDEDDTSWHNLYKELWKALINTVKQRRIIQNEMSQMHPNGVDYMFQELGIDKNVIEVL